MAKEEINNIENDSLLSSFMPTDFTDVGQGTLLAQAYSHRLRYCEGMDWLIYKEGAWHQSAIEAKGLSQKLTNLQLQEARKHQLENYKVGGTSSTSDYLKYAHSRRSSSRVSAALTEAMPLLGIKASDLDSDPLILNTPAGEVHLDTGTISPHVPEHLLTHMTEVSPSNKGKEQWDEFVLQVSCGDEEVAEFLQQIAGMASIGKVYEERLIIAVGSGGNGKSTFFNAMQDVLGDYAGTIRSELLISSNDNGKKFEFARLRGKRFIVAEELEESKQLDTASVKHLCSTGDINAQFKGKDIFTFKPSHTTVLCTNHLPTVKTIDNGTWDRLIIIPFNGRFRNQGTEIKNYGTYLVEHCGGAILSWIIEGAQKYISNNYKLIIPHSIVAEINSYKEECDWATAFFNDSLIFRSDQSSSGSELYDAYNTYCSISGITPQSQSTVLSRIKNQPGVVKKRLNKGTRYYGVGVNKPESLHILQTRVRECRDNIFSSSFIDNYL